jgi:hypothetical protein
MKNKLLSGVFLILLSACDVIVDVDVPIESPKITLNSVFIQDSTWKLQLMLNRHILDETDYKTVDDAEVIILDSGFPIDTLASQGNGLYAGDARAVAGRTYEAKVNSPAYGSVSGKSYVPMPVEIHNVSIVKSEGPRPETIKIDITYEMTDRPDEVNYYQLVLFSERKYQDRVTGEEKTTTFTVPIESKDLIIASAISRPNEGLFFKDDLFDGESISINLESLYFRNENDTTTLMLSLRTLSEAYYRYQVSSHIQERTANDPFAQPASVYNNIENGFGIFGGVSQSVFMYEE